MDEKLEFIIDLYRRGMPPPPIMYTRRQKHRGVIRAPEEYAPIRKMKATKKTRRKMAKASRKKNRG